MSNATRQKSDDGLTRCTRCRRHVIAGPTPSRTSCPFCARGTPRALRGAALATSLLAFGCGAGEPAVEATPEPEPVAIEALADPGPGASEAAADPEPVAIEAPADPEPTPEPAVTETEESADEAVDTFEIAPSMRGLPRYGRAPTRR